MRMRRNILQKVAPCKGVMEEEEGGVRVVVVVFFFFVLHFLGC